MNVDSKGYMYFSGGPHPELPPGTKAILQARNFAEGFNDWEVDIGRRADMTIEEARTLQVRIWRDRRWKGWELRVVAEINGEFLAVLPGRGAWEGSYKPQPSVPGELEIPRPPQSKI